MEKNNDFFTLERSKDGKTFEIITEIPGAGTSNKLLRYTYFDESPTSGFNYYKLKQTDYDGKFEYSNIVAIKMDETDAETSFKITKIFPNPFADQFNVQVEGATSETIILKLTDSNGNLVFEDKQQVESGTTVITAIPPASLHKGLYILSVSAAGKEGKVSRIMKQ
jgi:hypothetical protein